MHSHHLCLNRYNVLAVALFLVAGSVCAQTLPFHVGSAQPVVDEFGNTLEGSAAGSGDAVHILKASPAGEILPPAPDGSPDPANPYISAGETHIGHLTSSQLVDSGLFSQSVRYRPGDGTKVFARAFNAAAPGDATFYGDSQIFTVNGTAVFLAEIGSTDKPLDSGDDDGDGLNNSYESSYASDPNDPDSDDDGMNDFHEHLAGTGLNDPGSLLVIEDQADAGADDLVITWQTVAGKCYVIEYTDDDLAAAPQFMPAGASVQAVGESTSVAVVDGKLGGTRHFRVRLVDCP